MSVAVRPELRLVTGLPYHRNALPVQNERWQSRRNRSRHHRREHRLQVAQHEKPQLSSGTTTSTAAGLKRRFRLLNLCSDRRDDFETC